MKKKLFLFTVLALFLLVGGMGCEKDKDEDETCVFNVDDPINDLQWLKNKIPTTTSPDNSFNYSLYQNKKNPNKYFFSEHKQHHVVVELSYTAIYNCKGEKLMMKAIEGQTPKGWDEFFEENIFVKQIWPIE